MSVHHDQQQPPSVLQPPPHPQQLQPPPPSLSFHYLPQEIQEYIMLFFWTNHRWFPREWLMVRSLNQYWREFVEKLHLNGLNARPVWYKDLRRAALCFSMGLGRYVHTCALAETRKDANWHEMLSKLSGLKSLDVAENVLQGVTLPSLTNLTSLNLRRQMPLPEISILTNLTHLATSPPTDLSVLSSLPNLRSIHINCWKVIPISDWLRCLPHLTSISATGAFVTDNQFTRVVALDVCDFTCTQIDHLSNLTKISLWSTTNTSLLTDLTALRELELHSLCWKERDNDKVLGDLTQLTSLRSLELDLRFGDGIKGRAVYQKMFRSLPNLQLKFSSNII